MNPNPILDHSLDFSLRIIEYCDLLEEHKKYVISRQLLRAATSIGANVHEAQSPESKADFIHKMKIADKEARETEYWLILCQKAKSYPKNDSLLLRLIEIQKILNTILKNCREG